MIPRFVIEFYDGPTIQQTEKKNPPKNNIRVNLENIFNPLLRIMKLRCTCMVNNGLICTNR